jgi:hypothetical protein
MADGTPEYTARLIESDIVVGREAGNKFSIEMKLSSTDDLILQLAVPCGPDKNDTSTFILEKKDKRAEVVCRTSDKSPKLNRLLPGGVAPVRFVVWETPSTGFRVPQNTALSIDVTGFAAKVPAGNAEVSVRVRYRGDPAKFKFNEQIVKVPVTLNKGDEAGLRIHYFDASQDHILHAGEEEVHFAFFATGAKALALFKNNTQIWQGGGDVLSFGDKPSITSVYRLEARAAAATPGEDRGKLLKEGNLVGRSLTVQVAQAGWNREALQQGYPTSLMKALSFTAAEGDRLYGVFVDPTTQAAGLYSSETGFPPWRQEPASGIDFGSIESDKHRLSEMSHSPGLASGGQLWLVGGSSVDPEKCSDEVWRYVKDPATHMARWVRDEPAARFPKRMGHCLVEFQDTVWVLGGYDGSVALNDVWRYQPGSTTGQNKWIEVKPTAQAARWPERCMFTALATPAVPGEFESNPFRKPKIWIFGGKSSPDAIDLKTDLWSTTDGANWTRETQFELGSRAGGANAATLFWNGDRLNLAGSFRINTGDREDSVEALSAMVYSLCSERFLWEAHPVSWGWEQFGGNPFLMRSIVFNRFWFFWSLYQKITTAPKLNVFIPA